MTRKRYIKQLMAIGQSRNKANKAARYCQAHRLPYATDLESIRKIQRAIYQALAGEMERAILYGKYPDPLYYPGHRPLLEFLKPTPQTEYKMRVWQSYSILPSQALVKIVVPAQEETHLQQLYKLDDKDDQEPAAQWTKENPHRLDALDALSYTALVMGRGNSRNAVGPGAVTFSTVPVAELEKQEVPKDET